MSVAHHQHEFLKDYTVKDLMRKILDEEQLQQMQHLQHQYTNKLADPRRWSSNGCSSSTDGHRPKQRRRLEPVQRHPENTIVQAGSRWQG
jgi:hypothetical protein